MSATAAQRKLNMNPVEENGVREEKSVLNHIHPQTPSAALLAGLCVLCDAATALDPPPGAADVSASLRTSSLVAALMLASPALVEDRVVDQRTALAAVLAALSIGGSHRGGRLTRLSEAVFCAISITAATAIFAAGGIENSSTRPDSVHATPHRRRSLSALVNSLIFYTSLRGLRSAFALAAEARAFSVPYTIAGREFEAPGYAYGSADLSSPLAFGCCLAGLAALLSLVHVGAHRDGAAVVAFELLACAGMCAASAVWALLARGQLYDKLAPLYSPDACGADWNDLCTEAFRARRHASANGNPAVLFALSTCLAVQAFAKERRGPPSARRRLQRVWERQGSWVASGVLIAVGLAVLTHSSSLGNEAGTPVVWAGLLCLLGIWSAFVHELLIGSLLFGLGSVYASYTALLNFGEQAGLAQTAAVAFAVSAACHLTYAALLLFESCLSFQYSVDRRSSLVALRRTACTAGTSISTVLYLGGISLLACDDGSLIASTGVVQTGLGASRMAWFTIVHFSGVASWLIQFNDIHERSSASIAAWLFAPAFSACVQAVVLGSIVVLTPAIDVVDAGTFAIFGTASIAVWAVLAIA